MSRWRSETEGTREYFYSHYIRPPRLKRISSGNDKLKEAHNVYKFGEKLNYEKKLTK